MSSNLKDELDPNTVSNPELQEQWSYFYSKSWMVISIFQCLVNSGHVTDQIDNSWAATSVYCFSCHSDVKETQIT